MKMLLPNPKEGECNFPRKTISVRDQDEPTSAKSRTSDEPRLTKPHNDTDEQTSTKSSTEKADPIRDMPYTEARPQANETWKLGNATNELPLIRKKT